MKQCMFCKKTITQNHKCPSKQFDNPIRYAIQSPNSTSNTIMPIPKTSPKSISYIPQASNSFLPRTSNVLNLSFNCLLLKKVLNFLASLEPVFFFINRHTCDKNCILCLISQSTDILQDFQVNEIFAKLCQMYGKDIEMIDFPNCLQILLNSFHFAYLGKVSHSTCRYNCLSHSMFGINATEYIKCLCGAEKEIVWKKSCYYNSVHIDEKFRIFREAVLENNRAKLPLCPRNIDCMFKESSKGTIYNSLRKFVIIKLLYDSPAVYVPIDSFKSLDIPENAYYDLSHFACQTSSDVHVFRFSSLLWFCDSLNLVRIPWRSLQLILRQHNLKPTLLIYSTS